VRNEKFQDIVFNSNTGNDPEFKELRKGVLMSAELRSISISSGLIKDIRTADRQVKDLKGTVDMVGFPASADSDLSLRRREIATNSNTSVTLSCSREKHLLRR
jgi:hypothetical protein